MSFADFTRQLRQHRDKEYIRGSVKVVLERVHTSIINRFVERLMTKGMNYETALETVNTPIFKVGINYAIREQLLKECDESLKPLFEEEIRLSSHALIIDAVLTNFKQTIQQIK